MNWFNWLNWWTNEQYLGAECYIWSKCVCRIFLNTLTYWYAISNVLYLPREIT